MQAFQSIPWWWTFIANLLKRFEGIGTLASISKDDKPPPKDIWLDDDAIKQWRKAQLEPELKEPLDA